MLGQKIVKLVGSILNFHRHIDYFKVLATDIVFNENGIDALTFFS